MKISEAMLSVIVEAKDNKKVASTSNNYLIKIWEWYCKRRTQIWGNLEK